MIKNPICVALDTPDVARAQELARLVKPHAGYAKLGMEFFYAHGPKGYETVAKEGLPIFLDLKLHDIPNTVASGLRSLMRLDPKPAIVNIHATGGADMMRAAADAVDGRALLIGVTILTSLADADIHQAGFARELTGREHAAALAVLARQCGLDGVVCSAPDVRAVKTATAPDFITVVPGIRPADAAVQDQKRVATPRAALDEGADILVIGRPITGASDPAAAARDIARSLEASHAH
ncbi:orotidine-5'-phosphate decarboxylase [Nordella sp. HKS 07]|uniref:orotidine-5'-phosphate decarboxylase n=1 Tax=Nordella sp. HKS 07 TaxID=2712222 RepID=UPI0013E1BA49|nr:orotidine-5'-phosphate decarboxylase [Nordella sp. HKS 07]QIG48699.1 orotidine-5'-phosphate decarboxylase [Nordella sp. HKS 07]